MKYNSINFLIIFVLISLTACKASKEQSVNDDESEVSMVQNTPFLIMINFSMNSRDSVKVINTMKNPGRLRGVVNMNSEPQEGDLIISFLDQSNIVCSKTIVENPMIKRMEYAESQDMSILKAKIVELDSADFFIRVQYEDCFKHLRVEKFSNDKLIVLKYIPNFHFPL